MNQKKWRCTICGYVHVGQRPPSHCPICGVGAGMFEEVKEKVPEGAGIVVKKV
jgi:rubrerythrin